MFRTVFPSIIKSSRLYIQQQAFVKQTFLLLASKQTAVSDVCLLLYVQSWTPDDGRKERPKHVQCYSSKINLIHRCIWLFLLYKYTSIRVRPERVIEWPSCLLARWWWRRRRRRRWWWWLWLVVGVRLEIWSSCLSQWIHWLETGRPVTIVSKAVST